MVWHITTHGRPLCTHTSCQAGRDDVREASKRLGLSIRCGWEHEVQCREAVAHLHATAPHMEAKAVKGVCPEFGEYLADRAERGLPGDD